MRRYDFSVAEIKYFCIRLGYAISKGLYRVLEVSFSLSSSTFSIIIILLINFNFKILLESSDADVPLFQRLQSCMHSVFYFHNSLLSQKCICTNTDLSPLPPLSFLPTRNSSADRVLKAFFHETVRDCRNRKAKESKIFLLLFKLSLFSLKSSLWLTNSVRNTNDQTVAKVTAKVAKVLHRGKEPNKKIFK